MIDHDYFVGTLAQCEAYIAKIDDMMGPWRDSITITYAKPIPHASAPPLFLVIIQEVWGPKLGRQAFISDIDAASTGAEISARKKHSVLEAEGAFPQGEN